LAGENDIRNTYIVFLGETKELADLGSALWTETFWVNDICDAWNLGITLLDDAERKNGKIHGDDASTDGFTLALSGSAWAIARVSLREKKTNTGWVHDTLLHWETLLVVTTGNSEDVSLELVSDGISRNLSAHSVNPTSAAIPNRTYIRSIVPLVHEDAQLLLIFDLDQLLTAIGRLLVYVSSMFVGFAMKIS
jgi:hypothetical protein